MSALQLWTGEGFVVQDYCAPGAALRAADSWLVDHGQARALSAHRARFAASAGRDIEAFWTAALAEVPTSGAWFPRVDSTDAGLTFRLRPAPELHRSVILATHTGADPRVEPWIKGPDIDRLISARTAVQARGAQEAVLLDDDGRIIDGSTSALVWWRGDALCTPPATMPRVRSVTAATVSALAAARGVEVQEDDATPADLEGLEVWCLNALHGIRIVTAWVDGPQPAEQPGRLAAWRASLDALRRPLAA